MALQYEILDRGYAAVVGEFEERFSSYLEPTHAKNPPPGIPAEATTYFPFVFPGIWPVLAAAELSPVGGRPRRGNTKLRIRAIRIGLRIYHPALKIKGRGKEFEDGREAAKRVTREVWSKWLEAFQDDGELEAYDVELAMDLGDQDYRGGYLRQPDNPDTILWVHATQVEMPL